MKLGASQLLLLAGAELSSALPHMDSPRQRLLNGLDLPSKWLRGSGSGSSSGSSSNGRPYTPGNRNPYDEPVDSIGDELDPLPWRNGAGASVLGPWNPERARQNPDLIRPPSTDRGGVPNMRWSFVDSHIRIEVRGCRPVPSPQGLPTSRAAQRTANEAGVFPRVGGRLDA
jgi:hypothetical protein